MYTLLCTFHNLNDAGICVALTQISCFIEKVPQWALIIFTVVALMTVNIIEVQVEQQQDAKDLLHVVLAV